MHPILHTVLMRLCSISVDLDEIPNYYQIHGLSIPEGQVQTLVYDRAIERLESLATSYNIPLTLFAIGADLLRSPSAASKLQKAHQKGHEIANHSLDHLYRLTKLSREKLFSQIEESNQVLFKATGQRPIGFRAPGYTITDEVFDVLTEIGMHYDSSVFPCPFYWAMKSGAITWIGLKGRESHSVIDNPSVMRAPAVPYRIGRPYWKKGTGIMEFPIQVTRGLRLPYIGTMLTMAGPWYARVLTRMCIGEPFINLELHGIDVLDMEDGLSKLRLYQPDVRISKQRKLETFSSVIELLKKEGYAFVSLAEAKKQFEKRMEA